MSEIQNSCGAVGRLHAGAFKRRALTLRAHAFAGRLDSALAAGVSPWASSELMIRATWLGTRRQRRCVAAGIVSVVEAAEIRVPTLAYPLPVRRTLVLDYRRELLALAERLRRPEPVSVDVVAMLALLIRNPRSPLYRGGRPPAELHACMASTLSAAARG